LRGLVGTLSEAIDLLINADGRNDAGTRELFVSDVIRHFA
jgi:hypothetical protein